MLDRVTRGDRGCRHHIGTPVAAIHHDDTIDEHAAAANSVSGRAEGPTPHARQHRPPARTPSPHRRTRAREDVPRCESHFRVGISAPRIGSALVDERSPHRPTRDVRRRSVSNPAPRRRRGPRPPTPRNRRRRPPPAEPCRRRSAAPGDVLYGHPARRFSAARTPVGTVPTSRSHVDNGGCRLLR